MAEEGNARSRKQDWYSIWLNRFRNFMALPELSPDNLNEDDVIRFLRHLKSAGKPAWQRLQAVRSIIQFGSQQLHADVQHLAHIEQRLDDFIRAQQNGSAGADTTSLEGVAGPIDPNEPWVIRELRRKLRLKHRAYSTEQAYVGWIERFVKRFGIDQDSHWEHIGKKEVETFRPR